MKNAIKLILFLLFSGTASYAQDTLRLPVKKPDLSVSIAPLAILDPFGSLVPIGIEKNLGRWSVRAEFGIPLYRFGVYAPGANSWRIYGDYKASFAVRYYFKSASGDNVFFLNAEAFTREQRIDQREHGEYDVYTVAHHTNYYYNSALYYRSVWGWAVGCGTRHQLGKRVYFESFCGLGLRYVSIRHSDMTGLRTTEVSDEEIYIRLQPYGAFNTDGRFVRLHMPLGIRISYVLSSR